jgi:hypothetical protein
MHAYNPSVRAGGSRLINFSTTNSASEASIWLVAYNAATKSYASWCVILLVDYLAYLGEKFP